MWRPASGGPRWPLLLLAGLLAALALLCITLLSAARAYVGGESQWSRAQKTAALALLHYADTRAEEDWLRYRAAIAVPLGDRRAREELDRARPDMAVVREGFIAGLNHPDDIDGMARLYRWFGQVPFMARAISTWAEGDAGIDELDQLAHTLNNALHGGASPAEVRALMVRIHDSDRRLTALASRFSATLGEASRLTEMLLTASVVFGAAALATLALLYTRAATRRSLAQAQALQDVEARFQRAMEGSADGFFEWDLGQSRAYYSPRFETLLGLAPGTLSPRTDDAKELIHPDDRSAARQALSAHMRDGTPYDMTLRLRRGDGSWRWVRSRAQVKAGPGGLRLSGSISDIDDRRRAEEALRRSEMLFRTLWETTDDAVLLVGADHVIRFANSAAHRLFGHPTGSLVGRPLSVIQPERLRAAHVAGVARHMATHRRKLDWKGSEIVALHAAGHEIPMEIRFARLELDGAPHFVGFMRDITLRKQAEREIAQAQERLEHRVQERTQELQAANERLLELDGLKSQFLATMSHELRTPLNSILGFTAVLLQGLAGPLNDEQQRQLAFVQGSGRHLLDLINDLLDLSRIESGRMEVVAEPLDFAQVATEAADQLRPLAARKGIELRLKVDAPLPWHGDRRKLYQVLLNLAGNAVKFTEQGHVTIRARSDEAALWVEVEDTGIGIAEADQAQLFEAFRQVDGSLVRAHDGTGLGLYLSRKLVGLMDGRIGLRSQPGSGSCFSFSVPARAAAMQGVEPSVMVAAEVAALVSGQPAAQQVPHLPAADARALHDAGSR